MTSQRAQGLIEYSLILFLVCFVFWVGIKDTDIGGVVASQWTKITACLNAPLSCASAE
jgi:hypothetical protein